MLHVAIFSNRQFMHQSFVSTAPPPTGMGGDSDFFQSPGISPALWGQADGNKNSEYDQEIPQSQTADNPKAPRGRATQPSRDTRESN